MHVFMLTAMCGSAVNVAAGTVVAVEAKNGQSLVDAGAARVATLAEVALAKERGSVVEWREPAPEPEPEAKAEESPTSVVNETERPKKAKK